jgi:o-succinylbenzoate synthase
VKISSVNANIVRIPLVKPFIIASGPQTHYHGVLVKVCAGDHVGWGEAAPSKRVTGETERSVIRTLKRLAPRLKGRRPTLDLIPTIFNAKVPSAVAALDMAIHDLVARIEDRPVRDLYLAKGQRPRSSIETSITVSVGDLETTVRHAQELVDKGATTLKVKIGTDPGLDIERVVTLRKTFPKVKIRLDGNQGYNEDEAVKVLQALEPYDIQFIEQPVPRRATRAMARIMKRTSIPIMADEALLDHASLERIIAKGSADMINIKLMKVGGIREGHRIARTAIEAGLGIMVGCMIETRVGITAGTHLALADEGIGHTDLDGHLDLDLDITHGGARTRLGKNRIPRTPGLGLTISDEALENSSIRRFNQ